jgi:hypothetical protein
MKKLLIVIFSMFFLQPSFAQVSVRGYFRKNGTYVAPHQRTRPNSTVTDNYSYKDNVNPHTGKVGARTYTQPVKKMVYKYIGNKPLMVYYDNEIKSPKRYYEGTKTPLVKNKKPSYVPVTIPYTARTNTLSRFYVTYDMRSRGEYYEPFINPETHVEVLGRNPEGMYLVKHEEREGFIKEGELDSLAVYKMTPQEKEEEEFLMHYGRIDTSNYALGVVVAEVSIIRDYPETDEKNILAKPSKGSLIKVIAYDSNGFWVIKYQGMLGFMCEPFYRLLSNQEVDQYNKGIWSNPYIKLSRKRGLFGKFKVF